MNGCLLRKSSPEDEAGAALFSPPASAREVQTVKLPSSPGGKSQAPYGGLTTQRLRNDEILQRHDGMPGLMVSARLLRYVLSHAGIVPQGERVPPRYAALPLPPSPS